MNVEFHMADTVRLKKLELNDVEYNFGKPGDEVMIGDWESKGTDALGVRRGNTFYLNNILRC